VTSPVNENKASEDASTASRESLSELPARILNQLSVSACLPAGALVLIGLLYANLATHDDNIAKALASIATDELFDTHSACLGCCAGDDGHTGLRVRSDPATGGLLGHWTTGPLWSYLASVRCRRHLWNGTDYCNEGPNCRGATSPTRVR
jgi:hypothetical protein